MDRRDQTATQEPRFPFGANWRRFLATLTERRIQMAEDSLRERLQTSRLDGRSFLDVGSGSGLFSLAARRLGARVYSFDYDNESVACTRTLKERFFPGDAMWHVSQGSILDRSYLAGLGMFDVVYSWGVLHHTGNMWQAIGNAVELVKSGGVLFIAIYNDQGRISRYWTAVKKLYNSSRVLRLLMTVVHMPYLYFGRMAARTIRGRVGLERGMSLWYDMHDWLGGYPFEVAAAEHIVKYCGDRGLSLVRMMMCGRKSGCNEFVFVRRTPAPIGGPVAVETALDTPK